MEIKDVLGNTSAESLVKVSDRQLREAVYIGFGGRCFYSGRQVEFEKMHVDHIVPVNRGGLDCIGNYALTCQEINLSKNGKYTDTFGDVVLQAVRLIYTDKVVKIYNDLKWNGVGMIKAPDFLVSKGVKRNSPEWDSLRQKIAKLYRVKRSPHAYLYRVEDMEELFESHLLKQASAHEARGGKGKTGAIRELPLSTKRGYAKA